MRHTRVQKERRAIGLGGEAEMLVVMVEEEVTIVKCQNFGEQNLMPTIRNLRRSGTKMKTKQVFCFAPL